MKKKLLFALVLVFSLATLAHAAPVPVQSGPDDPSTLSPDLRGPIDPFPPPPTDLE